MDSRGLVHIYTGSGKGKTTAALGLCFRAAGHGFRCAFIQFLKKRKTGEMYSCSAIKPEILFEQFGTGNFISQNNTEAFEQQRVEAEKGLARAKEILDSRKFDIVVLDEIISLPVFKICNEERIIRLMEHERGMTELVLTGRGATDEMFWRADLVTEMREIKHYYSSGIQARKGIEY